MSISRRTMSLVGVALLAFGGVTGTAAALPVAPLGATATGMEQATLHRSHPGYRSRTARMFRHARRLSPNRYCRNQPSRCG